MCHLKRFQIKPLGHLHYDATLTFDMFALPERPDVYNMYYPDVTICFLFPQKRTRKQHFPPYQKPMAPIPLVLIN